MASELKRGQDLGVKCSMEAHADVIGFNHCISAVEKTQLEMGHVSGAFKLGFYFSATLNAFVYFSTSPSELIKASCHLYIGYLDPLERSLHLSDERVAKLFSINEKSLSMIQSAREKCH